MFRKILASTLSFMLIFANVSFAIVGVPDSRHWIPTSFGGGGAYPMIVPDRHTANKVYLVSDVNIPFVSTNKAESWSFITDNTHGWDIAQPSALYQSKTTASLLWAIGKSGIDKSTDSGVTWVRKNGGSATRTSSGKTIVINPTNDNDVFAGLDNGNIIRTTDGGTTWTTYAVPFGVNLKITFLYVNAAGTKLFVGGGTQGLMIYDLGTDIPTSVTLTGTNAVRQYDYDTYSDLSAVEHFCTTAGLKIACTADDGANWTYTAVLTATTTYMAWRIGTKQLAGGGVRMVVFRRLITNSASSSVEQYSNDGGATWGTSVLTKNSTMNPTEVMTVGGWNGDSIAMDLHDENIAWFTTNWNVFRSDDGGATYAEKVVGAQNTVVSDVQIAPNGTIFMCNMDCGCQYSTDHGATWTQALPTANSQGGHYWRVLLTGTEAEWNAGTGHAIVTSNWWSDSKPRVHRSTSNGLAGTWTTITYGLPQVSLYGDVIWPGAGSNGAGGFIRSAAKSTNGQTLYVGMDGENCKANPALPSNCSTNQVTGGTFISTDNGASWARANGNGTADGVLGISSPRKIYNALAVSPKNSSGSAASPSGTVVLFGTYGYNMYRSTNSGSTYSYVSAPSPYSMMNFIYDAAFDSAGHPYAVGTNSGPVIYKSITTSFGDANGSYSTWQLMKRFHPASVTSGISDGFVIDPNNNDRLFVAETLGANGSANGKRVWVTADAHNHTAATWTDITGDLSALGGCQALAIDPNEGAQGFLYCASNGGGLHKLNLADSPTVETGVVRFGK